jgi:hypothetical protein
VASIFFHLTIKNAVLTPAHVGDLGTSAKEVESALQTNFALPNRWDCSFLLDEAGVFLAERTKKRL